jgi:hypothetical protein
MSDCAPAGCYTTWPWPSTALPLWNDDVDGVTGHGFENSIGRAAEPWVSPEVVAVFSGIAGAVARIAQRGAGNHWVISGRTAGRCAS